MIWGVAFVVLESTQFVFFGGVFRRISSFVFGFLVFAITTLGFVGWAWVTAPGQIRAALARPGLLLAINVTAALSWLALLISVQLIEPAVAYTIGAGAMPIAALLFQRLGVSGGAGPRNGMEAAGVALIALAVAFLSLATVMGWSGFVRGDLQIAPWIALAGVSLAFGEGMLFTWLLILCQRIDRTGVGPGAIFGLRFPLYVLIAGAGAAVGLDSKAPLDAVEIALLVALGLLLIVPPLYALQRTVALLPTVTISVLTALGPFVIFVLQMVEGRVAYAPATLLGLAIYFAGALLAAYGAVGATLRAR